MSVVFHETERDTASWQIPPFEDTPERRLSAIEDQIREGEGYIQSQRSYKNLGANMKLFDGIFQDRTTSTLASNFLKYCIRKFVETLADVREIALYGSDAIQYKPYLEIQNKVVKAIYSESQYPRALRQALQYAVTMGIGYLWPKCKAEDYGFGERRIIFEPLGLLDVLPVQVPKSNDVQDAYCVTIYEYMPIAEAHARFPLFQEQLKPIDFIGQPTRFAARRIHWQERFRYGQDTRQWGNLYCELRYTFVRDMRINTTGSTLPMGDLGTSWYYEVPTVGAPVFGGIRNGFPFTRPARLEDCRVYPQLRLLISSPTVKQPLYDGPGFDWHGKLPTVQFTVDDWPWESLGLSLTDAVGSIEQTKRKHERQMDVVLTTKLDPPLGYDRTATGGPRMENFDIFEKSMRVGVDGKPREVLQSVLPDEVRVEPVNYQFVELLKTMIEQQLGINDLGNLIHMRANLNADSFDKATDPIGPIAKGIAASMEASNAKVAYMLKFMVPQWMDTKRIIEYVGPDQITPEMLDFDPASLIPSHLEDEYIEGVVLPMEEGPEGVVIPKRSYYTTMDRAKAFARNMRLISIPSTLLKITQQAEQLKYLQLYRGGFPISPHTVAKKLGIDNFGEIPGDTEFQKWVNWKKLEILLMAQAKELAGQVGLGGEGPSPGQGKPHAGGRPPSAQKAPAVKQKGKGEGNPRTTVTESR
jgi:hypothetical protein